MGKRLLSIIPLCLVATVAVVIAIATFLGDEAAKLRGPCVESAPQPALVGLPPAQPDDAVPAGPPPGAGGVVPFGEEPIQATAAAGEAARVRRALRYEPVLKIAKADRFWPVPVPAVLALSMGDRHTRFVGLDGDPHDAQPSDLRSDGDSTEFIDYPAEIEHAQDEFCSVGRALGIESVDLARWSTFPDLLRPDRTAQFYFLARDAKNGGEDLQYWFFYPYNYLPVLTLNPFFQEDPLGATLLAADFHEGDFEHVTVRLRPGKGGRLRPVEVEMARHRNEDKTLPWSGRTELKRVGTHPIVRAGFGGHASYAICGRQQRRINAVIRLLDWAICDEDQVFTLPPDVPLVDLRNVSWACWPGHFGEIPPDPFPELRVAGPVSPFRQAGNDRAVLCPRLG